MDKAYEQLEKDLRTLKDDVEVLKRDMVSYAREYGKIEINMERFAKSIDELF